MMIEETYRRLHAGSATRYQRAVELFPSGVTHDGRYISPFPLYIECSIGAHKCFVRYLRSWQCCCSAAAR